MRVRTKLLIGIAIVALIANLVWFSNRQPKNDKADFLLENTTSGTVYDQKFFDELPYFNHSVGHWESNGRKLGDIKSLVTDDDPKNLGPDSIGNHLIVAMPSDIDSTVQIETLRALVAEGICLVGFAEDTNPSPVDGLFETSIHKIDYVKDKSGKQIDCVDRINP